MHFKRPQQPSVRKDATGTVTLSCAALTVGKKGKIEPDSDGYYRIVLGGFNVNNFSGDFYPADERVKKLFEPNSALMRRVANGQLRGEYKHPSPVPGMTKKSWINRVCTIDEAMVSHHIKELIVDYTSFKNAKGEPVMTIIGLIKPCGPYGDALKASLENPNENVAFSIRTCSINKMNNGVYTRWVTDIATWDHVNEGGIDVANKYSSPSLEALNETEVTERLLNALITDGNGEEYSFESKTTIPTTALQNALEEIKYKEVSRSSYHW